MCTARALTVLKVTEGVHKVHWAWGWAVQWWRWWAKSNGSPQSAHFTSQGSSLASSGGDALPPLARFPAGVKSGLGNLAVGTRADDSATSSSSSLLLLLSPKTCLSFSKTSWLACFLSGPKGLFPCTVKLPLLLIASEVSSFLWTRKWEARSDQESFSPQPGIVHLATAPGKASFRAFVKARWASSRSSSLLLFPGGGCPCPPRLIPPPLFLTIRPRGPRDTWVPLGELEEVGGGQGWVTRGDISGGRAFAATLRPSVLDALKAGCGSWDWLNPPGSFKSNILKTSLRSLILLRAKFALPL